MYVPRPEQRVTADRNPLMIRFLVAYLFTATLFMIALVVSTG